MILSVRKKEVWGSGLVFYSGVVLGRVVLLHRIYKKSCHEDWEVLNGCVSGDWLVCRYREFGGAV